MESFKVFNLMAVLEKEVISISDCSEDNRMSKIGVFNSLTSAMEFLGTPSHYEMKGNVESNGWKVIGYKVKKVTI